MDTETPEPQTGGDLPAGPLARLGARLRAAREARGMSVRDISDQIRIRPALLEALEAGRRDELPADVFVRGFIRSYARCTGVDPDELKTDIERALGAPVHAAAPVARTAEFTPPSIPALRANKPHPYTVNQRSRGRIAFVLVLLGIVGLIVVTQVSDTEPGVPQVPEAAAPELKHEPAVTPLPADVAEAARAAESAQPGSEEGALGEPAAVPDVNAAEAASAATTVPASAPEAAASAPASTSIPASAAQAAADPAVEAPKPAATVPVTATAKPELPAQTEPEKPEPPKPPRPKVVAGFGTRYVQVSASGESWIIIYQDGKSIFERLMRAGEVVEYRFDGNAQLTAGNPSVVSVTVDGGPAAPFRKKSSPSRINLQ